MTLLTNVNRLVRKNAVYIVVAVLIALVYSQRKSFAEAADPTMIKHCTTLCGPTLQSIEKDEILIYKNGDVEDIDSTFTAGSRSANGLKELFGCPAGGAAVAAPAPSGGRRRR